MSYVAVVVAEAARRGFAGAHFAGSILSYRNLTGQAVPIDASEARNIAYHVIHKPAEPKTAA
jgi:hypothetical protein